MNIGLNCQNWSEIAKNRNINTKLQLLSGFLFPDFQPILCQNGRKKNRRWYLHLTGLFLPLASVFVRARWSNLERGVLGCINVTIPSPEEYSRPFSARCDLSVRAFRNVRSLFMIKKPMKSKTSCRMRLTRQGARRFSGWRRRGVSRDAEQAMQVYAVDSGNGVAQPRLDRIVLKSVHTASEKFSESEVLNSSIRRQTTWLLHVAASYVARCMHGAVSGLCLLRR